MHTVVGIGAVLWLVGAVALLVAHVVAGRPLDIWFTTCVCGLVLGIILGSALLNLGIFAVA